MPSDVLDERHVRAHRLAERDFDSGDVFGDSGHHVSGRTGELGDRVHCFLPKWMQTLPAIRSDQVTSTNPARRIESASASRERNVSVLFGRRLRALREVGIGASLAEDRSE